MTMTRTQQQLAWLAGASVVCVLVYARAWRAPGDAPAMETLPAALSGTAAASEVIAARGAQREQLASLTWARDPFAIGAQEGLDGLALTGILWDNERPVAVIGGEALAVGDTIRSFRVIAIGPEAVRLSDGVQEHELRLGP